MSIVTEYTYDEYPLNGTTWFPEDTHGTNIVPDICLLVAEYINNSTLTRTTTDGEICCSAIIDIYDIKKIVIEYSYDNQPQYLCLVKLIQDNETPVITNIHCWKILDETLALQETSISPVSSYWTLSPNSYGLEGRHQDITDNIEDFKSPVISDYYFTKSN